MEGVIWHTSNGGANWNYQTGGNGYPKDVQFINPQTGWITGYGSLIKTTNGGINWVILGTYHQYSGSYFINSETGWAIEHKLIYKTTDGGENWHLQFNFNFSYNLIDIRFVDSQTGWAVGENYGSSSNSSTIFNTTNSGLNWIVQNNIITPNPLNSIFFIDSQTGWVAGSNGTIFKTTNGGYTLITKQNATIPEKYILSQNYPNPFNPSTVISFSLPVDSRVSIKVYDVQGREVQTLVNERMGAGVYETTFDGAGLNSGVYFYQMRVGDYAETKRMILIK